MLRALTGSWKHSSFKARAAHCAWNFFFHVEPCVRALSPACAGKDWAAAEGVDSNVEPFTEATFRSQQSYPEARET